MVGVLWSYPPLQLAKEFRWLSTAEVQSRKFELLHYTTIRLKAEDEWNLGNSSLVGSALRETLNANGENLVEQGIDDGTPRSINTQQYGFYQNQQITFDWKRRVSAWQGSGYHSYCLGFALTRLECFKQPYIYSMLHSEETPMLSEAAWVIFPARSFTQA